MGVCASCLGNRQEPIEEDEESRLLDDPSNYQYGSFSEQNLNAQADPLESQREIEALQKVVAKTSNNLVDIFEIAPTQQTQHPAALAGQDARLSRYQTILAKLPADDDSSAAQGHVDWLSDDDTMDMQVDSPGVKTGGKDEAFVGTFANATV